MLNIGKLGGGAGGADYYLGKVASGVEDYYTGAGEAPGYWTGAGADALGLSGEVSAAQLRTLFGGADPTTGDDLGRRRHGRSVPGFDLAFRAPKSVSLVWALAGDEAMREAREVHDRAVAEALGYLEAHACGARRGAGGEPVDAHGFVGAAFRHRCSRAGDPLLHTHVVVANAVQAVDGAWLTLDARRLYTHAKTAGCVYQAVLRGELTRRLGVEWTAVRNGVADVAGVPRAVIDGFSQRRAEIVEHMTRRGETSAKAAQAATLHTRRAKDYGVDGQDLAHRWRAQANELGWTSQQAAALIRGGRELNTVDEAAARRELAGSQGLTARQASFTRREVIQAWAERLPDGATSRAAIERLADHTLDPSAGVAVALVAVGGDAPGADAARAVVDEIAARLGEPTAAGLRASAAFHRAAAVAVIAGGASPKEVAGEVCADSLAGARDVAAVLTWRAQRTAARLAPEEATALAHGLDAHAIIRRDDGRVVAAAPGETRYSTAELLAIEHRTVQAALARRGGGVAQADADTVDAALHRRPMLSDEQRAMVTHLATSGAGVDVVVGKAGAGKTLALDAAREAWQADGRRVIGAALAARAASELHTGAGIASSTLDGLLADVDRFGPSEGLPRGGVVVIDEAGMVGTRALARVLDAAEQAQAKVVLVGDDRQLPELDAGGIYRGLAHRLDAIALTDNRRQTQRWERAALDELRHGNPSAAVRAYQAGDRVTVADTAEDARAQLAADWWHARRQHGREAGVMIALRLADVDDLNARARARRRAAGELTGPAVTAGDGREFAAGDDVVCVRNDRRLGVVNGTRGVVTAVDEQAGGVTVDTGDRRVALPHAYVAERLAHGYATTAHKAQGLTTQRAWVFGCDEVYREWGYVACSRARHATYLYLTAGDEVDDAHTHHPNPDGDPVAGLAARLGRSRAQSPAMDEAAQAVEQARRRVAEFEAQADAARQRGRDAGRGLTAARRQARREAQAEARRADDLAARWRQRLHDLTGQQPPAARDRQVSDAHAREVDDDELTRRVQAAEFDPPRWVTTDLGPRPDVPTRRRAWRQALHTVEAYRHRWNLDDPEHAIGDAPADAGQHRQWQHARQVIDQARRTRMADRSHPHERESEMTRDMDDDLGADLA